MPRPSLILLVDDDADSRGLLAILLRCEGHDVSEVADGQRALDALASGGAFDVIVLDLMMPGMDGTTFLAQKARGAQAAVPVVIFSSSPALGLERFASVVSVVSKLAGMEELLAAVRRGEAVAPLFRGSRTIQS